MVRQVNTSNTDTRTRITKEARGTQKLKHREKQKKDQVLFNEYQQCPSKQQPSPLITSDVPLNEQVFQKNTLNYRLEENLNGMNREYFNDIQEEDGTTGGASGALQLNPPDEEEKEEPTFIKNKRREAVRTVSKDLASATSVFFRALTPLFEGDSKANELQNQLDVSFILAAKVAIESREKPAAHQNNAEIGSKLSGENQPLSPVFSLNLHRESLGEEHSEQEIQAVAQVLHAVARTWQLREYLIEGVEKNNNSLKVTITIIDGMMQPLILQEDILKVFPLYWLMSRGLLAAILTQLSFITLSILANYFKTTDENALKAFIAFIWPYCTQSVRSLETICEAIQRLQEVTEQLGKAHVNALLPALILPLVLFNIVGGIFLSQIEQQRIAIEQRLDESLRKIKDANTIQGLQAIEKAVMESLRKEAFAHKELTYLSAVYIGFFENLEHLNAVFFLALNPPAFIVTLAFTSVYILFGVVKAVYEQYEAQDALKTQAAKVSLLYLSKQFLMLQEEDQTLNQDTLDRLRLRIYDECRTLKELAKVSYWTLAMNGLKQGVSVYGALFATMSASIGFLSFASVTFPPILFVAALGFSLVLLTGSIVQALLAKAIREAALNERSLILDQKLKLLENAEGVDPILMQEILDLADDFSTVGSKKNAIEGWSTVVESFFLGAQSVSVSGEEAEGDLTLSSLIKHFAQVGDSLPGAIIGGVCSLIYAMILAAKAFYGAFGKDTESIRKEALKITEASSSSDMNQQSSALQEEQGFPQNEHAQGIEKEKEHIAEARVNAALNKFTLCNTHVEHRHEPEAAAEHRMQMPHSLNTIYATGKKHATLSHLNLVPKGSSTGIFQHPQNEMIEKQRYEKESEDEGEGDGEACAPSSH